MYLAWILWPATQVLGADVMTALRCDAPAVAASSMSLFDLLVVLQAWLIKLSIFVVLDLTWSCCGRGVGLGGLITIVVVHQMVSWRHFRGLNVAYFAAGSFG